MTTTAKRQKKSQENSPKQDLVELLGVVGMDQNNAQVYLACLELGPSPVWDIAKASGIKRSTCYLILGELVQEGFASVTYDKMRQVYTVIPPKQILFELKNKQEQMENALPQLEALQSRGHYKPQIRMFEGKEGIRQAYQISLDLPEGTEFVAYGNPSVLNNYPEMIALYIKRRVARKIKARVIIPEGALVKEVQARDFKELRQTRTLPKENFSQTTEVNILPNTVIYIAHSESQPFATVIESPTLAKEEKERFELLWEIAGKLAT